MFPFRLCILLVLLNTSLSPISLASMHIDIRPFNKACLPVAIHTRKMALFSCNDQLPKVSQLGKKPYEFLSNLCWYFDWLDDVKFLSSYSHLWLAHENSHAISRRQTSQHFSHPSALIFFLPPLPQSYLSLGNGKFL